jgi:aspartyl-tRNA(Asn)/glutamyl-tRNA(Gln) amidotransferase subunit C
MSLSLEEVRRIAALARLRLTPDEEERFAGQLSAILDHIEQLKALDVSGVEPMTHALAAGEASPLREDVVQESLPPGEAIAAAPAHEGTSFKVPRIIE